ncbi:MAG: hypothetical protein ABW096_21340 [Candidatus Thiodiazotropha sp.]
MNRVWRSFISATLLYALICPHLHAREAVCHIHAPDDYTPFSNQPLVIPAVGNQAECEQLNLERFSSRGRCHCTQDPIGMERIAPLDMMRSKGEEGQLP